MGVNTIMQEFQSFIDAWNSLSNGLTKEAIKQIANPAWEAYSSDRRSLLQFCSEATTQLNAAVTKLSTEGNITKEEIQDVIKIVTPALDSSFIKNILDCAGMNRDGEVRQIGLNIRDHWWTVFGEYFALNNMEIKREKSSCLLM